MLKQIKIKNLALISECEISFEPGFCVVTGETGAGKSVFLTSLKLCAGERATTQMIRNGEEKASVEGIFDIAALPQVLAKLTAMGIDPEEGEITIQREILANGKSRARINGSIVNLTDLSEIGEQLIQLHGQSEQVLLRDIRTHIEMLDAFGGHQNEIEIYQAAWREWQRNLSEDAELRKRASELAQQKEFLHFQADELTKAHLIAGEDTELEAKLSAATGAESERKLIAESIELLDGDAGINERFSSLEHALANLAGNNKSIAEFAAQLKDSSITLRELSRELATLRRAQPLSQAEIERHNTRIALLQKLQRKYRTTLDGLIELRDRRKQELATLDNLDDELILLQKRVQEWHERTIAAGQALHALRIKSASRMDTEVQVRIRELGMGKATFCTQIEAVAPTPAGIDRVEFLMAPNAGEGRKPLRQAVSGGELSRVLLAFKSVMAARDLIPVLIFDEVDSGISGEIAHRIGECLRGLGQSHQVLTITHLHQVACRAERQLRVTKTEQGGRTFTHITSLDSQARILEIARMLGDPKSETVLHHAKQILENPHSA